MRKGKGRRPAPAMLAEKRAMDNKRTTKILIDPEKIDPLWLNTFLGQIFFWSFTVKKTRPSDHTSKLRVSTHNYIPQQKLFPRVEAAFPDGCDVKLVHAYQFTHSFDIHLSQPLRFDDIIWRITKSLEDVL